MRNRIRVAHQYTIDRDPSQDLHATENDLYLSGGRWTIKHTSYYGTETYEITEKQARRWLRDALIRDPNQTTVFDGSLRTVVDEENALSDVVAEAQAIINDHEARGEYLAFTLSVTDEIITQVERNF